MKDGERERERERWCLLDEKYSDYEKKKEMEVKLLGNVIKRLFNGNLSMAKFNQAGAVIK